MRGLTKPDSLGGLILLAFAVFYLSQAFIYPYGADTGVGEGFMPIWLGAVLALLAAALVVQTTIANRPVAEEEAPARGRAMIWLATMVATLFVIDKLGMLIGVFIFTLVSTVMLSSSMAPGRRLLVGLATAVVLTGVIEALFQWWLKVQLPPGPFEFKGFIDLFLSR